MSVPRETNPLKRASRTATGNDSELTIFSKTKCTGDEMISSLLTLLFPAPIIGIPQIASVAAAPDQPLRIEY